MLAPHFHGTRGQRSKFAPFDQFLDQFGDPKNSAIGAPFTYATSPPPREALPTFTTDIGRVGGSSQAHTHPYDE